MDEHTSLRAQYLICKRLVRACRQGIYEMALDEDDSPEVRRAAIQAMKAILEDWVQAQKQLRRDLQSWQILHPVNTG